MELAKIFDEDGKVASGFVDKPLNELDPGEVVVKVAGAVDNMGGDALSWIASTMKTGSALASIGLAASHEFKTTVTPFIFRGVSLVGIYSVNAPMNIRMNVWNRLATDFKPRHFAEMATTLAFDDLSRRIRRLHEGDN